MSDNKEDTIEINNICKYCLANKVNKMDEREMFHFVVKHFKNTADLSEWQDFFRDRFEREWLGNINFKARFQILRDKHLLEIYCYRILYVSIIISLVFAILFLLKLILFYLL
jgi:hypothetical protein